MLGKKSQYIHYCNQYLIKVHKYIREMYFFYY